MKMTYEYIIKSPCKINLHLDIHNKRDDGYHDLTSIFQLISLEDIIYCNTNDSGLITLDGEFDCHYTENLIYKAAKMFFAESNIKDGVHFKIEKNIPSGGGVGGGSGNCAATLRLLNSIYNDVLSNNQLFEIGLRLGSDVPFFLGAGTALVQGRGEIITDLESILDYYILVVNPSIHISTSHAFKMLSNNHLLSEKDEQKTKDIVDAYKKGVDNFDFFKNSFELALFTDYTFINDIKTVLLAEGATYSALSGSGSTMFGIFKDIKQATMAKTILSLNDHYKIFLVKPLKEFPKMTRS